MYKEENTFRNANLIIPGDEELGAVYLGGLKVTTN